MRVSIVVPSYRQGRFLAACLESLIRQAASNLEIIVLDNCSDDETAAVLEAYRPALTRVEVRPDRGQADALRRGFEMATGDILGWLNCDDMLMPGAVERVEGVFEKTSTLDVVYGNCAQVDERGDFLGYFPYIRDYDEDELRNFNDFIPQSSTFFRRSAYEKAGGLDATLHYAMDWDLWCRMATAGAKFEFLSDVLSGVRIHPDAKTVRGGLRRFIEVSRVNLRHKTQFLPMVATMFVAHRFFRLLRLNRFTPLSRLLRRLWQKAGGRLITQRVILGVGCGPRLLDSSASIRFPVYKRCSQVAVSIQGAERARVRICGSEVTRSAGKWTAPFQDAPFLESVEVAIDDYQGPLPAKVFVRALIGEEIGDRRDPKRNLRAA